MSDRMGRWQSLPGCSWPGDWRYFGGRRFRVVTPRFSALLCLSLTVAEVARAYVFSGFPWGLVGYTWVDTPVYHLAAWIGPHGMTLLTCFAAYLMASKGRWVAFGVVVASTLIFALPEPAAPPISPQARVARLVHPDILQQDKWHPDKRDAHYAQHLHSTAAAPPVDLIVWPETAVHLPMDRARAHMAQAARGAHVLAGAVRKDGMGRYFNSLYAIGQGGAITGVYDKSRLVPFGEFIPFARLWARLGVFGLAGMERGGFHGGAGSHGF